MRSGSPHTLPGLNRYSLGGPLRCCINVPALETSGGPKNGGFALLLLVCWCSFGVHGCSFCSGPAFFSFSAVSSPPPAFAFISKTVFFFYLGSCEPTDESRSGDTRIGLIGDAAAQILSFPGIDFKIRTVELDGKKIKLQIW